MSGFNAFFAYAPDRSRWRQVSGYSGGNETTTYVGGLMEILTTNVRTNWKHRIFTPSGEVQVIRRNDGTSDVYYMTTDHLGSTDTVTDASAAVLVRESFGAWGARRSSNWQGSPSSGEWQQIANTTRRGYTGHEQIDNVLLVHMNGRVYDSAIGRFMSADPYVSCLVNSQAWNRYAYVDNRPLTYTDPTGYYKLGEGMNWKVVWVEKGYTPDGTSEVFDKFGNSLGGPALWHTPRTWGPLGLYVGDLGNRTGGGRNAGADGGGGAGRAGGGQGGSDRGKSKDKCMSTCTAAGDMVATLAGSAAAGATNGAQMSGANPLVTLIGGVAGLAAGVVSLQASQQSGSSSSSAVAVATSSGGAAAAYVSASAGQRGTAILGQVAGGLTSGLLSTSGMPSWLSNAYGGIAAGVGMPGKALLANVGLSMRQGVIAGVVGMSVTVALQQLVPTVCEAICSQ